MPDKRTLLEAIGIISKEVRNMAAENQEEQTRSGQCVECDANLTHPGAYFCETCAVDFYKTEEADE